MCAHGFFFQIVCGLDKRHRVELLSKLLEISAPRSSNFERKYIGSECEQFFGKTETNRSRRSTLMYRSPLSHFKFWQTEIKGNFSIWQEDLIGLRWPRWTKGNSRSRKCNQVECLRKTKEETATSRKLNVRCWTGFAGNRKFPESDAARNHVSFSRLQDCQRFAQTELRNCRPEIQFDPQYRHGCLISSFCCEPLTAS